MRIKDADTIDLTSAIVLSNDEEFRIYLHESPQTLLARKIKKINHDCNLHISKFPERFFYDEDRMACFLYDLKHFPIQMVLDRLVTEGARVEFSHIYI